MTDKKTNIVAGVMLVLIPLIFFFGIFCWKNPPFDYITDVKKLYYICIASVLYIGSFVTFLLARAKWLKICSSAVCSLFAVNLYMEITVGAKAWDIWDYMLIVIVALNYFLLYTVIEKLKSKNNVARNT